MYTLLKKTVFGLLLLGMITTLIALDRPKGKTRMLFDGKNSKQWITFSAQKTKPDTALFHVENGMLRAYGKHQGYLISKQSFKGNYKLCIEYRWNTDSTVTRASNKRNSGVIYNVPKTQKDTLWPMGIQFQMKDKSTGDMILMKGVSMLVNDVRTDTDKNYTLKRLMQEESPTGEWNRLEIVNENGSCMQYINGVYVNLCETPSVTEGRIVLMYEGYPIDFRDISITYLP